VLQKKPFATVQFTVPHKQAPLLVLLPSVIAHGFKFKFMVHELIVKLQNNPFKFEQFEVPQVQGLTVLARLPLMFKQLARLEQLLVLALHYIPVIVVQLVVPQVQKIVLMLTP